jgi:hypothetical protein
MKLTKENPDSDVFEFNGVKNIMINGGVGTVTLMRSVMTSDFHPMSTNINGGIAQFECNGGCAYNGTLESRGNSVSYRFTAEIESGEIEITMSRGG